MSLVSAASAKQLSDRTLDQKLESISERIKVLAAEGKRQLRTDSDYTEDKVLWQKGGYHQSENWKLAVAKISEQGYQVKFVVEEAQFTIMYTLIKW